jgi:FAD/FMN-containing dehydrogenase
MQACAEVFDIANAEAGPVLTAFEIIPRIGLDFILRHGTNSRDPLGQAFPWYALLEFSSSVPGQAAATATAFVLERCLDRGFIGDAVVAASEAQAVELWRMREYLSEVQKLEGGSIKHDISVPVPAIPAFIEEASAAVTRLMPGARPVPFGHFGDGNIHFNVSQPLGMDKAAFLNRWDEVSALVHDIVLRYDGSISAEHGIGQMKRDMLGRVKSPVELDMMEAIKRSLDPKNILNPGKVLFI